MKVFISWSGQKSELVALEIRGLLSSIFQSLDIWISKRDIPAGAQWHLMLSQALKDAGFGIVCLTKENINSNWLLFEAGAISKALDENRLVPLLIDLKKTELKGPLSFFQAITLDKAEVHNFVLQINRLNKNIFSDPEIIEVLFEKCWPRFEEKTGQINKVSYPKNKNDFTLIYSRELSILLLLQEGKKADEVAKELYMSRKTIQGYIENIKEKPGAKNIEEAIRFAKYYELL